jgi:streptogramin lyase
MVRKTSLIIASALCALAVSAFGWGSLISSFNAPAGGSYPNGIAYLSNYLYIGTNTPDMVYRTNTTGSVAASHTSPTGSTMGVARGTIGSTGYYWVVSYSPKLIYQVGYNSGTVYGSYTAPGVYPYGAAFRSSGSAYYIYYTDKNGQMLYALDATTGSVHSSHSLSFPPGDCAYDSDGYLWITDGTASVVRKCGLTGSVYDSFSVASYGSPSGCGYDGTYVWVGINNPLHSVLQFEVAGTAIAPASMGKIKATFR